MQYYTAIKINDHPLTNSAITMFEQAKITNNCGNKSFRLGLNVHNHINPTVLHLIDQHNLYIRFAELFYIPAHRTSLIHIDSEPNDYMIPGNMGKINFIDGGNDSLMHWYTPITEKEYVPTGTTGRNKFTSFEPNEVTCIASGNLLGYNIAQTGIPHNVTTNIETRYCVSLTMSIKHMEPKMIPYEILTTLLAHYRS